MFLAQAEVAGLESCSNPTSLSKVIPSFKSTAFESIHVMITTSSETLRLITIYRVPPNSKNKISPNAFIDDFTLLLESLASSTERLIIVGDFNIHWDDLENQERIKLADLLDMFGLEQHISQTTHSKGHILYFIVSRQSENVLQDARVDSLFSDHYALLCSLQIIRPPPQKERIKYRKLKNIDFVKC